MLAAATGVHASPARAAMAIPAALLLALLAGAVPAARAARSQPIAAGQLALINTLRAPGRTGLPTLALLAGE